MKKTTIKERYTLTYRMDMIDALNSAQCFQDLDVAYTDGSPSFGEAGYPKYTPSDDPRVIQMSLQFQF